MRTNLLFLAVIALALIAAPGCTKQIEEVIGGNVAPPDVTVENIVKENYINRVYITLLGRKPTETEFNQGFGIVDPANLDSASRAQFLDIVLSKNEFRDNQFIQAKADLIEGVDTMEIANTIAIYELLKQDPQYANIIDLLNDEIARMQSVLDIPKDLKSGTINERGMHRRLVDNPVYDEINMGTQNFVIATFNQLLLRYPTENELAQSSLMIEGFNGILFFEPGKSKDDYLTIFTESNDYFEGQVRDVYLRYLFREPLSHEVTTYAEQYKTSDDYSALLKVVLGSDEYAGI